jgi:hypothetical protein
MDAVWPVVETSVGILVALVLLGAVCLIDW